METKLEYKRLLDHYQPEEIDLTLRRLASNIRKRLRLDKDIVIAITGDEGEGKSALGVVLGALIDKRFDLEDNVSYLPNEKEIRDEFYGLKRYQCYLIDEAIRSLYKMNFMSNLQQSLVQMWATERFQNKCTILVLPRFIDLTENFRNHRVKLWINVISRGNAIAYVKDSDPHVRDPWFIDETYKYKQKKYKRKSPAMMEVDERVYIERKTRNFLAYLTFPDFAPYIKEEYVRLKQEARDNYMEEVNQEESKVDIEIKGYKNQINKLIYIAVKYGKIPRTKLANMLGKKAHYVSKVFKEKEEEARKEGLAVDRGLHNQLSFAINKERAKRFNNV